jgi:hypothetical protein
VTGAWKRRPGWEWLREIGLEIEEGRYDSIREAHEGLYDVSPAEWRALTERYLKGETRAHFHVHLPLPPEGGAIGRGQPIARDLFCVVYERPPISRADELHLDEASQSWRVKLDGCPPVVFGDEVDGAMLVSIPEFIEYIKPMPRPVRRLPAVKRLQLLETCLLSWPEAPQVVLRELGPPVRVGRDGESDATPIGLARRGDGVGGLAAIGFGERPDEIVETSSEVVDCGIMHLTTGVLSGRMDSWTPLLPLVFLVRDLLGRLHDGGGEYPLHHFVGG